MYNMAETHRIEQAPCLSAEEVDRRRRIVRDAYHSNRIEGLSANPAVEHVFEAFIAGEIEAHDIVPRLRRFHGIR